MDTPHEPLREYVFLEVGLTGVVGGSREWQQTYLRVWEATGAWRAGCRRSDVGQRDGAAAASWTGAAMFIWLRGSSARLFIFTSRPPSSVSTATTPHLHSSHYHTAELGVSTVLPFSASVLHAKSRQLFMQQGSWTKPPQNNIISSIWERVSTWDTFKNRAIIICCITCALQFTGKVTSRVSSK